MILSQWSVMGPSVPPANQLHHQQPQQELDPVQTRPMPRFMPVVELGRQPKVDDPDSEQAQRPPSSAPVLGWRTPRWGKPVQGTPARSWIQS